MTDLTDRGWVGVSAAVPPQVEEERPAAPPSEELSEPSTSGLSQRDDGFIQHKIVKTDTLAGLAVRYGITVSDIKRANGLLSDSAMFAREYINIPTRHLPLSEDAQVLFARLLSGYGRDASLNTRERKAPGTMAVVQLPGSPIAGACCSEEDDTGTPYSRRSDRSASEPGDVELIARQAGGEFMADGGAGGYGSDRVRRRHRASGTDAASAALQSASAAAIAAAGAIGGAADSAMGWLSTNGAEAVAAASAQLRGRFEAAGGRDSAQAVVGQTWHQLSSATSSLVQKIKRVASQPALGAAPVVGHSTNFADAADLVLMQRSQGLRHGPSSAASGVGGGMGGAGGGGGSIDVLSRGLPPVTVKKGCAKND